MSFAISASPLTKLFLCLSIFLSACQAKEEVKVIPNGGAIIWEKTIASKSDRDVFHALNVGEDGTIEAQLSRRLPQRKREAVKYIFSGDGEVIETEKLTAAKSQTHNLGPKPYFINLKDGGTLHSNSNRDEANTHHFTELLRKDAEGNIIWTKRLESLTPDPIRLSVFVHWMNEQNNGDIIITGIENGARKERIWFAIRVSATGETLWRFTEDKNDRLSRRGADLTLQRLTLENGDLIRIGYHDLNDNVMKQDSIPLIVRLSENGTKLTRREFFMGGDKTSFKHITRIEATAQSEAGFLLVGTSFIMKLDDALNPVWKKDIDLFEIVSENSEETRKSLGKIFVLINTLPNGNILIGGNLFEAGVNFAHYDHHSHVFLMMIDKTGEPLWFRRYDHKEKRYLRSVIIAPSESGEIGQEATMLLTTLPKEPATRNRRFKTSSYLLKVDLMNPPVDAAGVALGRNQNLFKSVPMPIEQFMKKDRIERHEGLENYTAQLTIRKVASQPIANICRQIFERLPAQHEDLFVPQASVPFQESIWVPWGNRVANLDPAIADIMSGRKKPQWEQIKSAEENRKVHKRVGAYVGKEHYDHENNLKTQRWHMKFPLPSLDGYMAKYDAAPPSPAEFYKRHSVEGTDYVIYPSGTTDYLPANGLRARYKDRHFRSYETLADLDSTYYVDGKLVSVSAYGVRVFDPSVAPDEKPYLHRHTMSRQIQTGPYRLNEGCAIKYAAKEEASTE